MTTITETLTDVSETPIEGVAVTIQVAGDGGRPLPAAYAPDGTLVNRFRTETDDEGVWSVDLPANESLSPAGTAYRIILTGKRVDSTPRYVTVPATAGPHDVADILTDAPGAIAPPALAAHQADTTDVHGIPDTSALLVTGDVGDTVQAHSADLDTLAAGGKPAALQAIDDGRYAPLSGRLVEQLPTQYLDGHRGMPDVWPESSMEGYEAAFPYADSIEVDVRPLSDGTLAVVHDSTTGRTMTGSNVDVDTLTPAEFQARYLKPILPGAPFCRPVLLSEVFDRFGGRKVITMDVKTTAIADDVVDFVNARNLKGSVILVSGDVDTVSSWVSQGFTARLGRANDIEDGGPTFAELEAAGITWVGCSYGQGQSYVESLVAQGLVVNVYAPASTATAEEIFGWGARSISADNARGMIPRRTADRTTERFDGGDGIGIYFADAGGTRNTMRVEHDGIFITDSATSDDTYLTLDRLGQGDLPCRIRIVATYGTPALDTNTRRWVWGLRIGYRLDGQVPTGTNNNTHSINVVQRRDGSRDFIRKDLDSGTTTVGSHSGTYDLSGDRREWEIEITDTTIDCRDVTEGESFSDPKTHGFTPTMPVYVTLSGFGGATTIHEVSIVRD